MNGDTFMGDVRPDLPFHRKITGQCFSLSVIINMQAYFCLFETIKNEKRRHFFCFDPFMN